MAAGAVLLTGSPDMAGGRAGVSGGSHAHETDVPLQNVKPVQVCGRNAAKCGYMGIRMIFSQLS